MNFLLAPNAMKGALSASAIAVIVEKSLRRKFPDSSVLLSPISDGGNGMLESLITVLGGTVHEKEVTGPLPSMKVNARFGITPDNIALIESAEVIGLHLFSPSPETIIQSTSYGIGELIIEVTRRHCKEIWIGLGGSGTNDGGSGMATALGSVLVNSQGENIREGVNQLSELQSIRPYQKELPLIKILADVKNILLGNHGATYTFAKQKGALDKQLPYLEAVLNNYADVVESNFQKEYRTIPGSGAAGGLAFGLLAFCQAEIVSGIDFILDTIHFDKKLQACDTVITTEGMLDEQTLFGKGISGITQRAKLFGKPVHAFVGRIQGNPQILKEQLHLTSLIQISPDEMPIAQAIKNAPWLLADAIFQHKF